MCCAATPGAVSAAVGTVGGTLAVVGAVGVAELANDSWNVRPSFRLVSNALVSVATVSADKVDCGRAKMCR